MEICKQQSDIKTRKNAIVEYLVMGVRVGVTNFFLDQSIGIDETNTFQLKFII